MYGHEEKLFYSHTIETPSSKPRGLMGQALQGSVSDRVPDSLAILRCDLLPAVPAHSEVDEFSLSVDSIGGLMTVPVSIQIA